jgi:hypothetical protein
MGKQELQVVYYSLFLQGDRADGELSKHLHSVRSLREHNSSIPVALEVYGRKVPRKHAAELGRLGVEVNHRGSLAGAFRKLCPGAPVRYLVMYAPAHKWLLARSAAARGCDRILYLDNDTLVLRDVAELFHRVRKYDWCAREEPYSERSIRESDPRIFDDREYARLIEQEGTRFVTPFNSGVVFLSGQAVRGLAAHLDRYLGYIWRFSLWMCRTPQRRRAAPPGAADAGSLVYRLRDTADVRAARRAGAHDRPGRYAPLRYGFGNRWIKEEVALWLVLGSLSLRGRLLSFQEAMQTPEYRAIQAPAQRPYLIHYFTSYQDAAMLDWWPRFRFEFPVY